MAYKKEEGCDYELVINDLNKCIDLYPYYEDAYHELREAKTILSDKYSQEEISSDQEKYYSFKNKLISSQLHEAYSVQRQALLNEIDQKIKNNPLNSEILLHLIKNLEGKYTEEQIGIASGYFYKSGQLKFLDKDKFLKAKTKIVNTIDVKDNSKYSSLLRYASEFCIFKQRFCFIDNEHGGRVYIPSRIVNETKTWDYSKTKLKDYNLDNLIKDEKEFYYFFDETRVKRIVEEQIKKHSFNEPMQYINVKQYWYLDESLQTCERLENEEIAEFHGIKYEDCDSWSSWCEETEFSM